MDNFNTSSFDIYKDISARTKGEIYLGVIGAVRTGKSTFIKRFMEQMVLPYMNDEHDRERTIDEMPQSAAGKTIMTTEPKFIPKEAAKIRLEDGTEVKVRLIDCVGYMVEGASGHMENDAERMVKTPWFDYEVPFTQAAEIGTKKVINEHSTIGIVIAADGTFTDIPRENYAAPEEKTVNELKKLGKPFIVLLNSTKPYSDETKELAQQMQEKYQVAVLPVNCEQLKKEDIHRILENVLYEYRKAEQEGIIGTQLIFSDIGTPRSGWKEEMLTVSWAEADTFDVYNYLKTELVKQGIPADQIAFIHDANTEVRKKELFSKVRRGAVRILMGSTFKMGAGTNVQDLIIASHDLDCPWRPRDLEQRAGRTVRQGNKNPKVDVVRYVTEGTFDAYLYQIIENKQKFISQIMTSKSPARSVEDIDEVALSYAEIKALAVGNPYIKEKMDLDIQVSKLQLLKQSFLSQKYEMEDKAVRYFPNEIRQCEQRIADYESDIALAKENTPPDRETFPEMQIHDVVYTEKKEAGQAIIEACKAMKSADAVLIGRYRGFPMKLSYDSFQKVFVISMYGKQVYHVPLGTDIHGNITRLDNKIQELPDKMLRCQDKLENLKVQLENAKEEAQKEFPQEEELAEKIARLGELNVLLDMDKKDQVLLDDGEGVEIEPEQKKKEHER